MAADPRSEMNDVQMVPADHPFPYLQTLPHYNPDNIWYGIDPILAALSLDELNASGFLNLAEEKIPKDPRYGTKQHKTTGRYEYDAEDAAAKDNAAKDTAAEDTAAKDTAAKDTAAEDTAAKDTHYHPIFRRRNFKGISDEEYQCLKPCLRLATDILETPEVLGWFLGLARMRAFRDSVLERRFKSLGGIVKRFEPVVLRRDRELWEAKDRVDVLTDCVTWSFEGGDVGVNWARTVPSTTRWAAEIGNYPSGLIPPQGVASNIHLRPEFLSVMKGDMKASEVDPAIDDASALLRQKMFLAKVMVHELCHAFYNAWTSNKDNVEPFMNDQRVAELGRALESWLYQGSPKVTGANPEHPLMPFGLQFYKWPNSDFFEERPVSKASPANQGVDRKSYYPLCMEYVAKTLTSEFWTEDAERFGARALVYPKKGLGVRYKLDMNTWKKEVRQVLPVENIMEGEPLPEVEEGILRANGVEALPEEAERLKMALGVTLPGWGARGDDDDSDSEMGEGDDDLEYEDGEYYDGEYYDEEDYYGGEDYHGGEDYYGGEDYHGGEDYYGGEYHDGAHDGDAGDGAHDRDPRAGDYYDEDYYNGDDPGDDRASIEEDAGEEMDLD